jgi:large subunit ribosomal protein L21e
MLSHKRIKTKGKISFSKFLTEFQPGDSVAVDIELAEPFSYNKKIHGKTGKVIEKRGSAYEVEIKDINKPKTYLLRPIHLKRIKE